VIAAPPPLVVHGDHGVAGIVVGRSTASAATARFGAALVERRGNDCVPRWPGLGLRLEFLSLGYGPACTKGVLIDARVTSRRFRTERGLRVGDPAARIRALYPKARGSWLVVRHACAEVGGAAYGSLVARVARGRVTRLALRTAPCE
jgi:hypothetical protein